jgi:hypothetical protein
VAEERWPSPRLVPRRFVLNPGRLEPEPAPETRIEHRSPETVGVAAGDWCAFGVDGEMPDDQRPDDAGSLTFESAPLPARLEILGTPIVSLTLSVDRPQAILAVRLGDVAPDGSAARVTYGLLNLAHRDDHAHPEAVTPGRRHRVRVALNHVAHAFPAGHRIRLAVSTAYWPIAWPAPAPVTLTLVTGASRVDLPTRPPRPGDARLAPFAGPESAPPVEHTELAPARFERAVGGDPGAGEMVHTIHSEGGGFGFAGPSRVEPIDLEIRHSMLRRYRIAAGDPLSARAEVAHATLLRRREWSARVESHASLSATPTTFELQATLDAWEGAARVFTRRWTRSIPRREV